MASAANKFSENAQGKFYVDRECIACDACVLAAPEHFSMHPDDGHAYVNKQPKTSDEEAKCKEALEACPVEAIGADGQ